MDDWGKDNDDEDEMDDTKVVADIEDYDNSNPDGAEQDDPSMDPVEQITKRALRMCDLTYDRAFAIDNFNLGIKLGEYTMSRLFEIFIDRVYKDTDEWFR